MQSSVGREGLTSTKLGLKSHWTVGVTWTELLSSRDHARCVLSSQRSILWQKVKREMQRNSDELLHSLSKEFPKAKTLNSHKKEVWLPRKEDRLATQSKQDMFDCVRMWEKEVRGRVKREQALLEKEQRKNVYVKAWK
ncbi:hypothetical protein NDU88_000509 [Pleurodeles waltl]|uniref:Uncharacterized protein n=1 Tax=Pleurodeles waltl TaxID=8319 RepID=A0AAV7VYN1_PLEWA|nr:hypothetical protein NDU88_000509 [Pleurodeles waltl]